MVIFSQVLRGFAQQFCEEFGSALGLFKLVFEGSEKQNHEFFPDKVYD